MYTDGTNVLDAFNDFESIALTGTPTTPTATKFTNTTQIASTAFVMSMAADIFIAIKSANQAIANGTPTKVLFQTENVDTMNAYNPSNSTFTVPVTGIYEFVGSIHLLGSASTNSYLDLYIDGSFASRLQEQGAPGNSILGCTGPMQLTAGQVIELYAGVTGTSATISSFFATTFFKGRRLK